MIREKSCGAVVYRMTRGKPLYLLIKHKEGYWSLPKGHVEAAETEEMTARREVREEVGLELRLVHQFREQISYESKPETLKDVIFYLGESVTGTVTLQPEEVAEFAWLLYEEALARLTYDDTKRVLEKAQGFLTSPRGA
jgi:8-oxo-dGTP pyrophosphatase MutT (NUDIX family)